MNMTSASYRCRRSNSTGSTRTGLSGPVTLVGAFVQQELPRFFANPKKKRPVCHSELHSMIRTLRWIEHSRDEPPVARRLLAPNADSVLASDHYPLSVTISFC